MTKHDKPMMARPEKYLKNNNLENKKEKMKKNLPITIGLILLAIALVALFMINLSDSNDHDMNNMSNKSEKASSYNQEDIDFAQGMIPHHKQAILMSNLVATQSSNEEIKKLALQIIDAQDPEIKLLNRLLKGFDADTEKMSHDMSKMDGMGMASDADLDELRNSNGTEFDELFLNAMIKHHEGAVEMANEVIEMGKNPEIISLASDIVKAQNEEIILMKSLKN